MMFNLIKGIPEAYQPLTNRAHRLSRIARVTPSSKLSSMVLLRVTSTSRWCISMGCGSLSLTAVWWCMRGSRCWTFSCWIRLHDMGMGQKVCFPKKPSNLGIKIGMHAQLLSIPMSLSLLTLRNGNGGFVCFIQPGILLLPGHQILQRKPTSFLLETEAALPSPSHWCHENGEQRIQHSQFLCLINLIDVYVRSYSFWFHVSYYLICGRFQPSMANSDYSCWSDEDFIGKVCRITRSNHPSTASFRTFQKCLGLYKRLFDGAWLPRARGPQEVSVKKLGPQASHRHLGTCPARWTSPASSHHHWHHHHYHHHHHYGSQSLAWSNNHQYTVHSRDWSMIMVDHHRSSRIKHYYFIVPMDDVFSSLLITMNRH